MTDTLRSMSGNAPSVPVALRREGIEREIAALHESIRQRKSRLNTLTPISTLPPEVLAEIFLCTVSQIEARYRPYYWTSRCPRYRWIKISHVCKHWREVALACPSLWTGIVNSSSTEWISLLLERSKQAPLQIDINDDSNMEWTCDVVHTEIHRIQDLRIKIPIHALGNLFDKIKGQIPILEKFTVFIDGRKEHAVESLSAILQHHLTPRLHQLEIDWNVLHWNYLTSMTLKHLSVHVNSTPSRLPVDPADFFAALERLPLLESLELCGDFLPFNGHVVAVAPPVRVFTLPRLRSIDVTAKTNNCINIFNHLSLPNLSSIKLLAMLSGDGAALARSLADKMTNLEELRSVYVDRMNTSAHIRGYTVVAPDFTIHLVDGYPPATVDLIVQDPSQIFVILPLAGVCSAVFSDGIVSDAKEVWVGIFDRLPNLEVLHVDQDRGTDGLPEALRHRESRINTEGEQLPVYTYSLPKLRMLRLSRVHFADRLSYDGGRLGKFESALQDCLMERYEYGAEILSLDLTRCRNLGWRGIGKLIEIMGAKIFWDRDISLTDYPYKEEEEQEEQDDEEE